MQNDLKYNAKARAHTNIALIKYWGKQNNKLRIPTTSSLSLTLDKFYTDTEVTFKKELTKDKVLFNGNLLSSYESERITNFLSIIRKKAGKNLYAEIKTENKVPTSAGLASSASGFAALAAAASKAIGMKLNYRQISRLARLGSGSATRSIFGGFVEWKKGFNNVSSYAKPLFKDLNWNIKMVAILINTKTKKLSSSKGMQLSKSTSPYYSAWEKQSQKDLINIKKAIKLKNFDKFGSITEENAMRMHALTLSANPDFTYFDSASLEAIKLIHKLRENGLSCYFTMDAGPNVKVLVEDKNLPLLVSELTSKFGKDNIVVASPGPGIKFLN